MKVSYPWPLFTNNQRSTAYSTLFPLGVGDFYFLRLPNIAIDEWVKHMLMYGDGWFGRGPNPASTPISAVLDMTELLRLLELILETQDLYEAILSAEENWFWRVRTAGSILLRNLESSL